MFRALVVLIALVPILAPRTAQAQQDVPRLEAGHRVRVYQSKHTVTGTLLSADSATMQLLTSHADTAHLTRSSVTRIELSVGQKSQAGKGALIGGAVGFFGVGLITYFLAGTPGLTSGDESLVYVAAGMVGGLVVGAGVGAIVGGLSPTDRWKQTTWPTVVVRLGGPGGKGVKIGLRIRF